MSLSIQPDAEALDLRMQDAPTSGFAFVDAGQGAALLLRGRDGQVIAIDSGSVASASAILDLLAWMGTRRVDLWVHTHYDSDHIGGFAWALRGADDVQNSEDDLLIDHLWDRGDTARPEHDAGRAYFAVVDSGALRRGGQLGSSHGSPGMWLSVVGRGEPTRGDENQRGLALCGELEGLRFFVQGDLPAELALDAARECGPVDLWWVGHHGSADAVDAAGELLSSLEPGLAVISAGQANTYCHPSAAVLEQLAGTPTAVLGLSQPDGPTACASVAPSWDPLFELMPQGVWVFAPP
jgi:competence protein ComEC